MGVWTIIGLILCVCGIFWATWKGLISKDTLQILANVATIVSLIVTILVLLVPSPESFEIVNDNHTKPSPQLSENLIAVINIISIISIITVVLIIGITRSIRRRTNLISRAEMLPGGYKTASPGAIIAILCVFMPWVLASCDSNDPSKAERMSGFDFMIRLFNTEAFMDSVISPLFLAPLITVLFAFLVLYFSLSAWHNKTLSLQIDGYLIIGLGIVSLSSIIWLLVFIVHFDITLILPFLFGMNIDKHDGLLMIQFGLYGTILGQIAIIIGGLITRKLF